MAGVSQASQGRRGYYLYEYGTHLWFPQTQEDFSAGVFRDSARAAIPANGVYDAVDLMFFRPGMAFKRGGNAYAGPAMTSATYAQAVAYVPFPDAGGQLVGLGATNNHIYKITNGATTDMGAALATADKPKLFIGGPENILVITSAAGNAVPYLYDGTNQPQAFAGANTNVTLSTVGGPTGGTFTLTFGSQTTGTINWNTTAGQMQTALNALSNAGSGFTCTGGAFPGTPIVVTRPVISTEAEPVPILHFGTNSLTGGVSPTLLFAPVAVTDVPTGKYSEIHLERLVLANSGRVSTGANPNRVWFSPVTNISGGTAWDMAEAWIDFPETVTGMCSIANSTLLVFGQAGVYKLVGDTPPPGTNMTLTKVAETGCTDARSITRVAGTCYFANPEGIYSTQGVGNPANLLEGRMATYWRSLLASYDPTTWIISTGCHARRFLFVNVLDNSGAIVTNLMCDLTSGAWTRLSNQAGTMFSASVGTQPELYMSLRSTNRVVAMSGLFSPAASNKNDADGTAVTWTLETRPFGNPPSLNAFGKAFLSYDMRDAASDNPTIAVSVAPGLEATTYGAVPESPLSETTDATKTRYAPGKRSEALSHKFVQSNASSKTEIYAIEQQARGFPRAVSGQ